MRSAHAAPGRPYLSWPSSRELRRAAHRHAPDAAAALPSLTLLLALRKPAVQGLPQKGARALEGLSSYLQRTCEARPRRAAPGRPRAGCAGNASERGVHAICGERCRQCRAGCRGRPAPSSAAASPCS